MIQYIQGDEDMTKICSKCGEEKPATTEYFEKAKGNKDGLRGQCKECRNQYHKQRRKENKEYYREYSKQYRKENKEEIKEYANQWRQENKEEIKEYANQWHKENKEYYKQYRERNTEYLQQYNKQYHKENRDHRIAYDKQFRKENKEYYKQYYQENIDRCRQYNQKRKAFKKRLPATLTLEQWGKIKDDFNNECAYCGKTEQEHKEEFNEQLHQEHFIPLTKGGGYTHDNIIPACKSCNCSKNNTDFFEWYPTYEYYNEEREQFILEYLGYTEGTQQLILEIEAI